MDVYQELEQAVYELSSRGLHQASRWAAEQLAGLDPALLQHATHAAQTGTTSHSLRMDPVDRAPQYMLAKEHFEFKEYRRAAGVLEGLTGPKPLFLRCWCLYLAGEKRKEEEREEAGDGKSDPTRPTATTAGLPYRSGGVLLLAARKGAGTTVNRELGGIEAALREALHGGTADAYCAYLLGLVLLDKGSKAEAQDMLLLSLRSCPINWSAWMALQRVVVESHSLHVLPPDPGCLPFSHWAADFFLASASLELQANMEALARLQRLSHTFPTSASVEAMVAQAHYNLQNFEESQVLFEDLLARDPYRLEGLDTFSNILFVKEQPAALSLLAHRAMSTDKYRAETCCVVGNYYSLKGHHEQAVTWFRRALKLQRTCLAAWTLMGHEYMEMKNTAAAIEAYRAAVELSSHDYRAWYGLGQAHELLKLPFYALYYYRRAAALRPGDARMWCALGQCYAHPQVGAQELALRCYQRAVDQQDPEGVALHLLAKLRESRGELDEAERLYRANLARLDAEAGGLAGGPGAPPLSSDAVDALLFLAGHSKDTGRLAEAKACCERLMDVGGPAREQAKAVAREIHALLAVQQQQEASISGVAPGNQQQQQLPQRSMHDDLQLAAGQQQQQHSSAAPTYAQQPSQAAGGSSMQGAGGDTTPGHTSTPQLAKFSDGWGMHDMPVTMAPHMHHHGTGRNLFSALGHVMGETGSQQGSGSSRQASRPPEGISPLPAPLFGSTPAPTPPHAYHQGSPMTLAATMRLGGGEQRTPPTGHTARMSDSSTPASAIMQQTPGGYLGGWPGTGAGAGTSLAALQHTPGAAAWAAGGPSPGEGGGPSPMDMATPQPAAAQEPGSAPPTAGIGGTPAGAGGPAAGGQEEGGRSEAVRAVAQQLRVSTSHAAVLLAAAGDDPVLAIRNNLHLLGPVLQ